MKGVIIMQEESNGFERKDQENANDNNDHNQYSSYYTPPYYTPNFTVESNSEPTPPPPKKGKAKFIVLIAAVLVTVILTSIISTSLFSFLTSKNSNGSSQTINMDREAITIVKSSPKIEVLQSTDDSYVPQSIPEVVQKVGNSVVEISTSSVVNDRFFHQYVTSGAGSGVIITQSSVAGYLLTNHHVIDGATEITVRLTSGEEYSAQILGSDAELDLAVLRIPKNGHEEFTVASIGDSSVLAVGQEVIAIGNPLGSLGGTVTDGIISALDRTVVIGGVSMVLLQHNAAINPGNSGGGLFDAMGNLIGIVNAKTSETGIEGLGFAIPSNIAYNFFNRVIVTEPALGIKVTYGSVGRVAGVYVTDVNNNNTGFEMYDRILAVNGQAIGSIADYYAAIDALQIGDTVTMRISRSNRTIDVTVTLE